MTTAEVFGLSNPMAVLKPAHADAVDIGELVQTYSTVLFRVAHSILRNRTEGRRCGAGGVRARAGTPGQAA